MANVHLCRSLLVPSFLPAPPPSPPRVRLTLDTAQGNDGYREMCTPYPPGSDQTGPRAATVATRNSEAVEDRDELRRFSPQIPLMSTSRMLMRPHCRRVGRHITVGMSSRRRVGPGPVIGMFRYGLQSVVA
jgi:hypothetical protein